MGVFGSNEDDPERQPLLRPVGFNIFRVQQVHRRAGAADFPVWAPAEFTERGLWQNSSIVVFFWTNQGQLSPPKDSLGPRSESLLGVIPVLSSALNTGAL